MSDVPKVMLAADLAKVGNDFSHLPESGLYSPKLDGVRSIIWQGVAYSRNAKPLRNRFLQRWASRHHNLDGEFIVGAPTGGEVLGRSMAVTAFEGEPEFTFYAFDAIHQDKPFLARWQHVKDEYEGEFRIEIVPHVAANRRAAPQLEEAWLAMGYEGMMVRETLGLYKHGRSTLKEGGLVKVKQFQDGEAVVVGLEEAMTNTNPAFKDELGRTKRSTAQAGMVGSGMVGTILAKDKKWGLLRIAPGKMTHAERQSHWWHHINRTTPHTLIGRTIHWRSFGYGVKDAPRFARYYGIREKGI